MYDLHRSSFGKICYKSKALLSLITYFFNDKLFYSFKSKNLWIYNTVKKARRTNASPICYEDPSFNFDNFRG